MQNRSRRKWAAKDKRFFALVFCISIRFYVVFLSELAPRVQGRNR
jgi:hypothetical protein